MNNLGIFGIYRERSHSPKREFDDEAILKLTAMKLSESLGVDIPLLHPEEFLRAGLDFSPRLIFFMCEEEPYLARLKEFQHAMGTFLVNTVQSVENTFRKSMIEILSETEFFPKSFVLSTREASMHHSNGPVWIKRGDYHAIEEKDVVFAPDNQAFNECIGGFIKREIESVVIQSHVPGDIIKFYSVTDLANNRQFWFKWFYHKDQELKKYPFSQDELHSRCQAAGRLLGLEIFGGDAIVDPDGNIYVIDVNAWPSFALFRDEASSAISALITHRLLEQADSTGVQDRRNAAGACSPAP